MGKERSLWKDGRSITAMVQSRMDQFNAQRKQRQLTHEQGHTPELCYPGEIGHFPEEVEEGGLVAPDSQYDPYLEDVRTIYQAEDHPTTD